MSDKQQQQPAKPLVVPPCAYHGRVKVIDDVMDPVPDLVENRNILDDDDSSTDEEEQSQRQNNN